MADINLEKTVAVQELRAYKRFFLPQKATVSSNGELAVNAAGALLTTDADGNIKTIGEAAPLPPTPGLAAVAAADATGIGRSFSVTGTITVSASVSAATSVITPLVSSAANLTLEAATGKIILANNSVLTGTAPTTPITATKQGPDIANFSTSVGTPSTTFVGFINIDTTTTVVDGRVTVVVPTDALVNDPSFFLQLDQDTPAYDTAYGTPKVGAVSVAGSQISFDILFTSSVAAPRSFNIHWFLACRA